MLTTAFALPCLHAADLDEDDFDLQQALLLSTTQNDAPIVAPAPVLVMEENGEDLELEEAMRLSQLNLAPVEENGEDLELEEAMRLSQLNLAPVEENDEDLELEEAMRLSQLNLAPVEENDEDLELEEAMRLSQLNLVPVVEENDENFNELLARSALEQEKREQEEEDALFALSLREYEDRWDQNWMAGDGNTPAMVGLNERIEAEQAARRARLLEENKINKFQ